MGVSEYPVPINTRMILEKGLRVFGSSRSGVADFEKTVQMYQQYPEIIDYLGNLISSVNVVRTTTDIKQAFEKDTQKAFAKPLWFGRNKKFRRRIICAAFFVIYF